MGAQPVYGDPKNPFSKHLGVNPKPLRAKKNVRIKPMAVHVNVASESENTCCCKLIAFLLVIGAALVTAYSLGWIKPPEWIKSTDKKVTLTRRYQLRADSSDSVAEVGCCSGAAPCIATAVGVAAVATAGTSFGLWKWKKNRHQ